MTDSSRVCACWLTPSKNTALRSSCSSTTAVKSVVTIPVMTVGRYLSLAAAEAVLVAGKADLVVFGRAVLADPVLRGHKVVIMTNSAPFGGLLALRAAIPYAREVRKAVEYFRVIVSDLGIEVLDEAPNSPFDVRVDARPGQPIYPSIPGLHPSGIVLGEQILAGLVSLDSIGSRVAAMGWEPVPPPDGVETYSVADLWEPFAAARRTALATRLARDL